MGVRSIARHLTISPTTVLKRIIKIAQSISKPTIFTSKNYQVDELCTFIGKKTKRIWICYGIDTVTKKVVDFRVGRRTNKTLNGIIETLVLSKPKSIHTDKLKNYKTLIPKCIHKTTRFGTNHIERMNLNLRTHLKRLNRRTICYSKSVSILIAVLKIYFWNDLYRQKNFG